MDEKRKLKYRLELGKLATFSGNIRFPVYSWFHYKEAFSRDLVLEIIEAFNLRKGDLVLDNFCGIGTTLLTCKELGINSIGFDILPITVFSSRVKTTDYDPVELKETAKKFFKQKFEFVDINIPDHIKRYFKKETIEDISFFLRQLDSIDSPKTRNFFKLALINSAISASLSYKDGAVLKFRKRKVKPLRPVFKSHAFRMIRDIKKSNTLKVNATTAFGDARSLPLKSSSIDAVITSPPYLGQPDYQTAYRLENFFLGKGVSESEFIGKETEAYFSDMSKALKEMYRVLKEGGKTGIVIGNGFTGGKVVESDLILSELAEKTGFSLDSIFVLNERPALKERTKKVEVLRESLIVLEK